jgi:hypothetical protein
MATEFLDYPKGRLALGAGDLIDVYDISGTVEDGEQSVSTLRQNPAGSTGGKRVAKLTFKSAISEEGFERDYWKKYQKREVVQGRFKVPGKVFTVTGRLTSPSLTSNVDSAVDNSWTLVGRFEVE